MLFQFGESTTKEHKSELIGKLKSRQEEIPAIENLKVGKDFTKRSKGYDIGLFIEFSNVESFEQYSPHPKHQEVVAYLQEIGVKDIIVNDFKS
ncbi:Dabb family protein [Ureibacillus sp. NPDC094379]